MSAVDDLRRFAWIPGVMSPVSFDYDRCNKRDRLVSLMLQDRKSLRLISAPCGYGKSTLASEYAHRMFAGNEVAWVDGSSPEFLNGLDRSFEIPVDGGNLPALVIFEDVSFLDEDRAEAFRAVIELLLDRGIEVVVTIRPSDDCLRNAQDDRILLTAHDLLVTERDVRMACAGMLEQDRATNIESWRAAGDKLFGRAPCSVWGPSSSSESCLASFFEERLPMGFLHTVFMMALYGKATFLDVENAGVSVRAEDVAMMLLDYPFLGVDPMQTEFCIGDMNFAELQRAVMRSGYGERFLKDEGDACQMCVLKLLRDGRVERAVKLIDTFFSDAQCEQWVERHGWSLLDIGEAALLESLVARCGEHALMNSPMLQALQSWVCGLQGDAREALYYAKAAMSAFGAWDALDCECIAYPIAYLAFVAFRLDEPLEFQKPIGTLMPHTPLEHVASMVCFCTESELAKGLGVLRGQFVIRNAPASEELDGVDKEREELIENLIISCDKQCRDTTGFRLILHIAACLSSDPLKEAVQEYGCGIMISMRKRGVNTFTEAALVADLWRGGFFGATPRGDDIRDGRLLDGSSALINRLARMSGRGPCAIPWEAGNPETISESEEEKGKRPKKPRSKSTKRLPVAKVTMFGGMEVMIGDRYLPESYWNRRSLQLFSILVLHQGRDVSRDTLFTLLWPGLTKSRARDNFYTAWSHMAALLGEGPYLVRRGEFCSISRYVSSDVAEFNQLVRRLLTERENTSVILDIYARMETLYRGGLLPGETGCEFIDHQRDKYRSIYVDGMVAATHKSLDARDARVALWFARRAMDEDDKREDVYYAMIRAQIAAGQRCSAIRTYFQCRKFLSDELGLDPSTKTEALYEQLLLSDPTLAKLRPESFR